MTAQDVMFLEGEELYLRPLEESDAERCQRWINDPKVRWFLAMQFPMGMAAELRWLRSRDGEQVPPADIPLAIVLKDGNRHIGNIGLHGIDWVNRAASTGMMIGEKEYWGKGYGYAAKELLLSYAFDTLGLVRIQSMTASFNPRSFSCLTKSGYVIEGTLRKAFYRDGEWHDVVMLGLLAEEWRAHKGA